MRRTAWVALLALPLVGRGFLNGDAAAYYAQAVHGDLTDRWTHVGYVLLAALPARLGPVGLDLLGVAAGLGAALAAVRLAARDGRPEVAAAATAAALLPWTPFAEVDPVWIALVTASAAGLPGAAALATAVSPVALLALPWAAAERRGPAPLIEAALAVAALSAMSWGAWWTGERGVLETGPLLVGRAAGQWLLGLPWAVLLVTAREPRRLAALLLLAPLLLAPPDVPGWAMGGVAAAMAASRARLDRWMWGAVALQLALGLGEGVLRARQVADEDRIVREVAAEMAPGVGLVAPWTWGARVAVVASGDPYGVPWHPPGRFLRDQQARWAGVEHILRLPAEAPLE